MKRIIGMLPLMTIILIAGLSIYAQEVYNISKEGIVEFVDKNSLNKEDAINFYNITDGQETKSLFKVNEVFPNVAYKNGDTIRFELNAGHKLKVLIIENKFKYDLSEADCVNHSKFKMKKQSLKIVKLDNERTPFKIQGSIFYEGVRIRSHQYQLAERTLVKGYFELDILNQNNQ